MGHDGHDGHDHDDDHGHGHGGHEHRKSIPPPVRGTHDNKATVVHEYKKHDLKPDLERAKPLGLGEGRGKILFLDAPSGLAGDMFIAAMVDLGVPADVVANAIAALSISGFRVEFGTRVRSGIVATSFEVHVETPQPARTYADVRAILDAARLPEGVRARAQRTFFRLAQAEAKVHRSPIDEVHFHEVGAIDAIADVVGSAAALEYLGAELVVSPLPMGRGFVQAAHGKLPLPAPATIECLAGLSTYDAGLEFEFVTPTGAAIVGAHASGSHRWPSMNPERIGWGAGTADLKDRPNVLRAILGAHSGVPAVRPPPGAHVATGGAPISPRPATIPSVPPASMRAPATIPSVPAASMRVPPTGSASVRPPAPASPSVRPASPGTIPDEASPTDAVRAIPTATHTVLEANVDDASGELAASWIEALLAAGALDVWVTPIIMKKGRPAMTISALTVAERADAVAHTLLRETTSLGLRRYDVTRLERPRTIEYAETPFGRIPIKVAAGPFGPPQVKPEFDACAVAARAHGVPVREVLRAATAAAIARVGER